MELIQHIKPTFSTTIRQELAKIRALPLHDKVHLASMTALMTFSLLNGLVPWARPVLSIAVVASFHGFLVGFAIWAWHLVQRTWSTTAGKAVVTVLNLVALLLATMLARYQVSMAMGLPAQDFDLTVGILVLVFYLPAWAFLVGTMLAPSSFLVFPVVLVGSLLNKPSGSILKAFAHVVGAVGLSIYASQLFAWSAGDKPFLHTAIRMVAAFADYQPAANYPGVSKGQRIRLHENGVISTVLFGNNGVTVEVRQLDK